MTDNLPNFRRLYLTDEWQEIADDFEEHFEDRGCTCFLGKPPCGYCTHPGNPICLDETDEAWVDEFTAAVRYFAEQS